MWCQFYEIGVFKLILFLLQFKNRQNLYRMSLTQSQSSRYTLNLLNLSLLNLSLLNLSLLILILNLN